MSDPIFSSRLARVQHFATDLAAQEKPEREEPVRKPYKHRVNSRRRDGLIVDRKPRQRARKKK